jgi:hypothetical protein
MKYRVILAGSMDSHPEIDLDDEYTIVCSNSTDVSALINRFESLDLKDDMIGSIAILNQLQDPQFQLWYEFEKLVELDCDTHCFSNNLLCWTHNGVGVKDAHMIKRILKNHIKNENLRIRPNKDEKNLLVNAVECPDGTVLQSYHRHDYKTHTDSVTGTTVTIDGGVDYIHKGGDFNNPEFKWVELYEGDDHEMIRKWFAWGTYGKNGDQPLKWVKLKDMSDAHINALLTPQRLSDKIERLFKVELKYREDNNLEVLDSEN